jgi:C4-dicarboxylate-specific signal transduction histidine kinase
MDSDWDIIGKEGLQFFGKMSASISHEIKNVLAIINENAGLLEDFTLMAEKGKQIDMERFKTVAGKIRGNVGRADVIVKNLNRFAHSADDFSGEIDLNELIGFVVALSERMAAMVDVSFEHIEADRTVPLNTSPFILQNLLWLCFNFALEVADGDKKVHLLVEKIESGARIKFSNLEGIEKIPGDRFPSHKEKALLEALGAQISLDEGEGELILEVPDGVEH